MTLNEGGRAGVRVGSGVGCCGWGGGGWVGSDAVGRGWRGCGVWVGRVEGGQWNERMVGEREEGCRGRWGGWERGRGQEREGADGWSGLCLDCGD